MTVRTRFAPSPTGYLHIGGVRTALFNWLFARQHGGQFILRIDDTDQQRNVDEALAPILHGLDWLGIDWDEGPEIGGPYGPYYQSQRGDRYQAAVEKLLAAGAAYCDYATTEELQAEREAAEREKRVFLYSRRFLAETAADRARFEAEGRRPAVRLKMPREGTLVIRDLIRGDVAVQWAREQDHVIQRADGSFLYHLANVVDDHDFKITHVIRAEEHLSNTPRQIFIAQSLGYELPMYAHLPFVAEPGSKTKLSKRKLDKYLKNADFAALMKHGRKVADALKMEVDQNTFNPVVVDFYEQVGYLPEAIINYLALLGWALDDRAEHFSREELIGHFSLERVNKAAASFDPKKLWAFQDWHMQQLPLEQKVERVVPYLQRAGLADSQLTDDERAKIEHVVRAAGDRIKTSGDVLDYDYFFQPDEKLTLDADVLKGLIPTEAEAALLRNFCEKVRLMRGLNRQRLYEILEIVTHLQSGTRSTPPPYDYDALRSWEFAEHSEQFEQREIEATIKAYFKEEQVALIRSLRFALTAKTKGVGLYETIVILGKDSVLARLNHALRLAGYTELESTIPGMESIAALPETIKELYDFSDVGQPIVLHEGDFQLDINQVTIKSHGRLELKLVPVPTTSFSLVVDSQLPSRLGSARLTVPGLSLDVPALITSAQMVSTSCLATVAGVPNGPITVTCREPKLQQVTFHLTDFHDYAGSGVRSHDSRHAWAGRLSLKSAQWVITIDEVPNLKDRFVNASKFGSVPMTHVGQIARSDGSDFSPDQSKPVLEATRWFLSLTRGHWVATLLAEGFDRFGSRIWQDWTLWRVRTVRGYDSWCPIRDMKYVEAFFPEFFNRWCNRQWRELINFAISRYLECNKQGQVDSSIVSARVVVEAIGEFVQNELASVSENSNKPLHGLELITDVLDRVRIPNEIPGRLFMLRDFAATERLDSAIETLTRIRNASIHPNKDSREFLTRLASKRHAFFDASRLAIWQCELCLLWLLGYTGRYQSRVQAEWVGETEPVPWDKAMIFDAVTGA